MKVQLFLSSAALATACLCLPQIAAARSNTVILSGIEAPLTLKNTTVDASTYQLADRGRGRGGDGGGDRGRGGDRDHDSRGDRDHDRGSDRDHDQRRNHDRDNNRDGGRRTRIPGGSGCDDAGDVAEHAGCS
jgi:hypothetical protein